MTGRQMRLLETLQEYDFDIEYYPDARNYIQDALSRRSDHKTPPIPRISPGRHPPTSMASTAPNVTPTAKCSEPTDCAPDCGTPEVSTELLLARGIQADE